MMTPIALEDCAIRSTFVSEKEDHWAAGGEVALVGGIDYMLAQAAILEITEEFGMQLGVVPFARRGECQSDRLPGVDDDVDVSAIWSGAVDAASVEIHGIELDGFIAGFDPVEGSGLLSWQAGGEQDDCEWKNPHSTETNWCAALRQRKRLVFSYIGHVEGLWRCGQAAYSLR